MASAQTVSKQIIPFLSKASSFVSSYFTQRNVHALIIIYGGLYLGTVVLEYLIRADQEVPFRFIDSRRSYSPNELSVYLQKFQGGQVYLLQLFLLIKAGASFCASVLASFTVSFICVALTQQQDYLDFMEAKKEGRTLDPQKHIQAKVSQFRTTLMNIIPLFVSVFELSESLVLLACTILYPNISGLAFVAAKVTSIKWMFFRSSMSFITLALISVVKL
jgi:hypothetical protein